MDLTEYKRRFGDQDDAAPGWDAITSRADEVYGGQEPKHWGAAIRYSLGGPDPLDGISAYECQDGVDHLHFVTYGYTSLYYDEASVGGEFSQYGFEMTFRLASPLPYTEEPLWVCSLLQNIARYVFETNNWFEPYQWLPANGPIRADGDTDIVGLVFLNDPTLSSVDSPHGRVEFIQAFGVTQAELDGLDNSKQTTERLVERHRESNPLLVTDLARQ